MENFEDKVKEVLTKHNCVLVGRAVITDDTKNFMAQTLPNQVMGEEKEDTVKRMQECQAEVGSLCKENKKELKCCVIIEGDSCRASVFLKDTPPEEETKPEST